MASRPAPPHQEENVGKAGESWLHPSSLYYGWILAAVLGVTTILSYGTTHYLFGVLVVPLSETFHWSRANISGANALSLLVAGVLGIPVGYLLDRQGPRLLMTLGSLLGGFSLIGLSFMQAEWQFYLLWAGGIGATMALVLYPVSMTVITNWFVRKRGQALTVLTLLGGLASPIFLPLAGVLIPYLGWRSTLLCFGLLHVLIAAPLHGLLLRRAPEQIGLAPDGERHRTEEEQPHKMQLPGMSVKDALHKRAFWLLTAAFSLSLLGTVVLATHQVAHLIHRGHNATLAATLIGSLGLASLLGRLLINRIGERISSHHLMWICHCIQAIGVSILILASSIYWLVLFVLLFGASSGAIAPLKASIMADAFGRRAYGAITAIQGIFIAFCSAGGPLIAGWLYDLFGDYNLPFWLCSLGFLVAAGCILLTPRDSSSLDPIRS